MAFNAAWVLVMGFIAFKLFRNFKYNLWLGAIIGGLVHIALYTLIKIPMFGLAYALSTLLTLSLQTLSGVILGNILYGMMKNKIKVEAI